MNWKTIHSIILSVTCHSLRNFPLFIHIPPYPFVKFWNPTRYYLWIWVIHKRLNVNWKKIHSIMLSLTCHSLINFVPHSDTSPHIHLWIFETLWLIISWVWVICKRLNVNWKKIHSIILSVTCHSFRNFPPLIHIPSYPFVNFQNPTTDYFFEFESFVKCWIRIGKKFTQ